MFLETVSEVTVCEGHSVVKRHSVHPECFLAVLLRDRSLGWDVHLVHIFFIGSPKYIHLLTQLPVTCCRDIHDSIQLVHRRYCMKTEVIRFPIMESDDHLEDYPHQNRQLLPALSPIGETVNLLRFTKNSQHQNRQLSPAPSPIGETVNLLHFTENSRQTRFAKSAIVVEKPPSTSQ